MSRTFKIVNGDCVYDQSGRPTTISDKPKLSQDLAEMLAIETQPNGFGAGIVSLIGTEDGGLHDGLDANMEFAIRDKLEVATNRFIAIQRQNLKNRPTTEQLKGLDFLQVQVSATDPSLFGWQASFSTVDGKFLTKKGTIG